MRFALLVVFASMAWGANSTIADIIYNSPGQRANGWIYVTPSRQFTCADGHAVYQVTVAVRVTNGVFSVSLCPDDTGSPTGTFYFARFALNTAVGTTEFWIVPTSGSTLNLTAVRSSTVPSTLMPISPAQIGQAGATTGTSLVWSGTSWSPGIGGRTFAFTSQTSVTCTHNLNSTMVGVDVVDTFGNTIIPALVQRTSVNAVVVTFDAATSGTVRVQ